MKRVKLIIVLAYCVFLSSIAKNPQNYYADKGEEASQKSINVIPCSQAYFELADLDMQKEESDSVIINLNRGIEYKHEKSNSPETMEKLSIIEDEVDNRVEEILKDVQKMSGYCHMFWETKKRLLKEEYGIDWLTPAECNPDIMFD